MAVVLTYAGAPADGEGRPHRRPVRQAALLADREEGRRGAADLSGDIVNGTEFTTESRTPDARRQLQAYRQSAATLNLLRAFAEGGYANLASVQQWMLSADQGFATGTPLPGACRAHQRGAQLHASLRPRSDTLL